MNPDPTAGDRLLQIVAVLLIGVTTLGTAWCAYQASQWAGTRSDQNRIEAGHRLEANREFGVAVQSVNVDSAVAGKYAQAVQSGDAALAE